MFRPLNTLYRWLFWIFIVYIAVNVFAIISDFILASSLQKSIDGYYASDFELIVAGLIQMTIGFIQFGLLVTTAVLFLIWIYRAHKNLPVFGATDLRFTPGWAVGWFFIPVMSLFKPYQVVKEIWKASKSYKESISMDNWKNTDSPPIIGWWWAFFITGNILDSFLLQLSKFSETPQIMILEAYSYAITDFIDIIGIIFTILLLKQITLYQDNNMYLIYQQRNNKPSLQADNIS
jgi:hypothetical protein